MRDVGAGFTTRQDDGIACTLDGGIATITLDRPDRRNAMDMPMRAAFARAVTLATEDDQVQAIVLTGRGSHFCAGGDIGAMNTAVPMGADVGRARMRQVLDAITLLHQCDKPVLAAVEGCAYGGGFGLALMADMVIAADGARFCMSFARVGLVPDSGAFYALPRLVGVQRAKYLMWSAQELDAQHALQWGIAMEVVLKGLALERTLQIARALATASPAVLALSKAALNSSLHSDFRTMAELEASAQGVAFATPYHRAAIERFLAKQPPAFQWPTSMPSAEFNPRRPG
ncbi:enoyl-CoA hydratase/isomerase family protein [Ottowia flava]|uniref:Enoyl-CoA hydratase/isomerase family protein n=1 Tax=Ottowia flava TaxID=2675430 RepID=A0ABW4KWM5_9BURK|nr:enoyl-CoA hydratase/isomerase family protein [Ottowia sp. GY511]